MANVLSNLIKLGSSVDAPPRQRPQCARYGGVPVKRVNADDANSEAPNF
jgi:hypothetical protein